MSPSLRQYRRCRIRDNDSNFELDKLNRNLGVAVAAVLRPARLDRDRATLDPTEFAQSMRKSGGPQSVGRRRGRAQEPDRRQLARLLRPRRERPSGGRAAEQRNELATFQLIELHSVPSQGLIAGYRIGEDQSGGNETIDAGDRGAFGECRRSEPASA